MWISISYYPEMGNNTERIYPIWISKLEICCEVIEYIVLPSLLPLVPSPLSMKIDYHNSRMVIDSILTHVVAFALPVQICCKQNCYNRPKKMPTLLCRGDQFDAHMIAFPQPVQLCYKQNCCYLEKHYPCCYIRTANNFPFKSTSSPFALNLSPHQHQPRFLSTLIFYLFNIELFFCSNVFRLTSGGFPCYHA